jgi:hypothetical protein
LWGTSNGTFVTDRVGNILISFVEYSASKKVRLQPDIVEYSLGDQAPMYDLIIGKQTMHNLGVKLDFQEKTITIDKILYDKAITKLYKQLRNLLSGDTKSQWDCDCREMHERDLWAAVNKVT